MKFIRNPFEFFVMNEYNFSLFGAIFGFLLVLAILCKLERSSMRRYIDGVTLSFLFALVIGYVGAFFGGQVYGRETMLGIEMMYTHPYTQVPYSLPVFPLPVIYAFISFFIFSGIYILSLFVHIKGFIGYIGLLLFSAMILVFEFFSGKHDILSINSVFNLPQVFALILAVWSGYQLFQIFKGEGDNSEMHIES